MHRLLPLVLLTACGLPHEIPREDYATVAAGVFCDRLRECARGQFDRAHFGRRDCRAGVGIDLELSARAAEDAGCVYRAEAASELIRDLADMSCGAFYEEQYVEGLDAIWDCAGG